MPRMGELVRRLSVSGAGLLFVSAAAAQSPPAPAALGAETPSEPLSTFWDAVGSGRTWLNLRYRYEHADIDGFPKKSDASTLRTALGYETGRYKGFRGFVEFESVDAIGSERFNSTVNGQTDRPPIPDPIGTEVNQAYLGYDGFESVDGRLGRQTVVYGNSRFIGDVAWRQNYQTFEAVRLTSDELGAVDFDYTFAHRVNRIFGERSPQGTEEVNSHFLNAHFDWARVGKVTLHGYAYDHRDSVALRSTTFGARLAGIQELDALDVGYVLEFAQQNDAFSNPIKIDQQYYFAEASARFDLFSFFLGWEQLGGSGEVGNKFSTPFATLHKFNGFADLFLVTPDEGLIDRYATLAIFFPVDALPRRPSLTATYHVFDSDAGNIRYGQEFDFVFAVPVTERATVAFKWADFRADQRFEDTLRYAAYVTLRVL